MSLTSSHFFLGQLNQWIQHFDFRCADASNKPSSIGNQTLNSTTHSLKQKGERFSAISIELYGK